MTAIKSTSPSTSSTPQCQTPISQTPRSQSPVRESASDKQTRTDLSHALEANWNGLLLNDYLNCDSYAAEELFAAEREQLQVPEEEEEGSAAATKVEKKVRSFLERTRDAMEEGWNGLVWMDWMNCDTGAVQDLWAEERRRLGEATAESEGGKASEEKWSSINTGM